MKQRRHSSKLRKTRRRMRGGGAGQGYSFGAPIVSGLGNSAEVVPYSSCMAVPRPGEVGLPFRGLGLPGLSGGGKRKGGRRTRQKGGRYTFDLSQQIAPAAPWAGGIPQAVRIPCEGSIINPLNPGPHTPSTQPPIQSGGVGGVDSAFYYAPTAGYSNTASTWVGSTGAPAMVQTPYEARAYNPACIKTAGGGRSRRHSRKLRKSSSVKTRRI